MASGRNKFKREIERLQFGIKCLLNTKAVGEYGKILYSEDEDTRLLGEKIINGYEVFLYEIDEKLQAVFQDDQFIYFIDCNMNETEVIKIVEEMR